ncbi:MAG: hypothetical protein WBA31_03810 [Candidatus Dormiibacterota bacterium]
MAFTQNDLLPPDEFVEGAGRRGVHLRTEQLMELHRRRALVPLFRIVRQGSNLDATTTVSPAAARGYGQFGTPLSAVIEAAAQGRLVDPATRPCRPWDRGLPVKVHGRLHRYPSVYYSPYQLLGLHALKALADRMEASATLGGSLRIHLDPLPLQDIEVLDRGRRLAVLLSAIDMHYLPRIFLKIGQFPQWRSEDLAFDAAERLGPFHLPAKALAGVARDLLYHAMTTDPLGSWYQIIQQAHPATWSELRYNALLAMDCRIAAEVLLRAVDDLGRSDLTTRPPGLGPMVSTLLDDRLQPNPPRLEAQLTERGLSPRPALLLVLEGETEMLLMPRVLDEIHGKPVPPTLVDFVDMKTIDRDLDLLVRREVAPQLGEDAGDFVLLTRPPTRVLVAVDPEKKYATRSVRDRERDKIVRRLHESLPVPYRSAQSLRDLSSLVKVTTWGSVPWEFANFTDRELARSIMACVALPPSERSVRRRSPNVELVCVTWPRKFRKIELAEALWPCLQRKVVRYRSAAAHSRIPALRVATSALELARGTNRGRVGLRIR